MKMPCRQENVEFNETWEQWYQFILDIVDTKLYKPSQPKKSKEPPKNVCVISFVNKGIDHLCLPSIFKSTDVTYLLPRSTYGDHETY